MLKAIGWVLSPSRMIFDNLKVKVKDRGRFHRRWSRLFIYSEIIFFVTASASTAIFSEISEHILLAIPLLIIAWSRINELGFAFYNDAISHLKGDDPVSDLQPYERLQMALKSYFGLIVYFSIVYYFSWFNCSFSSSLDTFIDSTYFSTITMTTLGYGDISPTHWVTKLASMYQVLLGLLIVVVVIATYAGLGKRNA